jgi:hypothetical protein
VGTDTTYSDSSGGSVKIFTDLQRVGKITFINPLIDVNTQLTQLWCSGCSYAEFGLFVSWSSPREPLHHCIKLRQLHLVALQSLKKNQIIHINKRTK